MSKEVPDAYLLPPHAMVGRVPLMNTGRNFAIVVEPHGDGVEFRFGHLCGNSEQGLYPSCRHGTWASARAFVALLRAAVDELEAQLPAEDQPAVSGVAIT